MINVRNSNFLSNLFLVALLIVTPVSSSVNEWHYSWQRVSCSGCLYHPVWTAHGVVFDFSLFICL